MYDVEAEIVTGYPSVTYLPSELLEMDGGEWTTLVEIPQLESNSAEYAEAKKVAEILRRYYKSVRITKSTLGGNLREVITECPYTHAHTRHWCGYSECREG